MYNEKAFLGKGWKFPVSVDKISGRISESSYEENIMDSIKIILETQKGERIMRPEFGCNLKSYTFAEINYTVTSAIEEDVMNALIMWEPRIIDINVKCNRVNTVEAVLNIDISYVVRSTNNPYNMVYPFYLNENN